MKTEDFPCVIEARKIVMKQLEFYIEMMKPDKMRIAFCGDLHLEFGDRDFELPDADILLLAGDICVIEHLQNLHSHEYDVCAQFFKDVSTKYRNVLWTHGNHELYGGIIGVSSVDIVRKFLYSLDITNVEYITCGSRVIGDVMFIAATMWTDFNKGNPSIMNAAQYGMNDYRKIMIGDKSIDSGVRYITAKDILDVNSEHTNYISDILEYKFEKTVVMTHHAPNVKSSGANKPSELDYAYCCSNLDDMILDNPQIKYWIHGHTHNRVEYKIGETTVISNCRGYKNYERDADTFQIKVIEL